jgi:hypothetical protein
VLFVALLFAVFIVQYGWRYVITGTFLTLSFVLLAANIQELGRD